MNTLDAIFAGPWGPLVIFVGRLVEEKGVGDLLRALALLSPSRRDVSALILGDGQQRAEFEAMAAQLGIARRVTFVGWVDPLEGSDPLDRLLSEDSEE